MKKLLEIRSYVLKPGSGAAFHDLISHQSVPLLRQWGMDVVAFGPSVQQQDQYWLMRAFDDLTHLQAAQDAFYASDVWCQGPREAIVSLIESSANSVLWLDQIALEVLRQSTARAAQ